MPRFLYVGSLLGLATCLALAVSAQTSVSNIAQKKTEKIEVQTLGKPAQSGPEGIASHTARVQRVIVSGSDAAMEVEIRTSGAPVSPNTQAIQGPDRIIVDFPGALPAAELRALKVNRGALKAIRAGLFFSNPPITRIVLDLMEPQLYRISTTQVSPTESAIVLKLSPANAAPIASDAAKGRELPAAAAAKLQNTALAPVTTAVPTNVAASNVPSTVSSRVPSEEANQPPLPPVSAAPPLPPKPLVTVIFENGMLRIRTEKATLAQVLFEVQRQTQAEIPIPAGAEQEQVVADLGPAPAREVLASLLNGSPYNFIFIGNEQTLERVILTRRSASIF